MKSKQDSIAECAPAISTDSAQVTQGCAEGVQLEKRTAEPDPMDHVELMFAKMFGSEPDL